MAAYVIGHITVRNSEKFAEYRSKVPATLAPWKGEVILRGRRIAVLSGEHAHTDTVVIRFPDAGAATGWYGSPAYQALIPIREQAAEMVLISYES
jgi:uncharacterized protein (DUF1330 family)